MRLEVVHDLPGRVRFRVDTELSPAVVKGHLLRLLAAVPGLEISYSRETGRFLAVGDRNAPLRADLERAATASEPPRSEWDALIATGEAAVESKRVPASKAAAEIVLPKLARFLLVKWLTPAWLRPFTTAFRVAPYLTAGVGEASRGRLSVPVLDATAIGAALLMRDLPTASTIAFLLDLGESLEAWTRAQVRRDVAVLYRGTVEPAWVLRGGTEVQVAPGELRVGDTVVVRMGARIPVDGVVVSGEALVNQAAMTGEAQAIAKRPGLTVFAGTVVEEGQLLIDAKLVGPETRFATIARLIENADSLKAEVTSEAERLAARAVPYTFGAAGLVFLLTRSWVRAASVLVVDYSCALKLATPLALKSAMLEALHHGTLIKGGKHLETLARADVFIFDKTGTLTEARPSVAAVIPMNGHTREEVLRNAACLEEHFPHPVATAIVQQAIREKLDHEERHSKVDYMLAHGIVSTLDGERLVVGSRHFVEDHEQVDTAPAAERAAVETSQGRGVLYFAIGGKLAGLIAVDDPLLPEGPEVIRRMKALGVKRVVMVTGDNEAAARTVARRLGLTEVYADVLPDEKTEIVRRFQADGHIVAMVGDGLNDTAALAVADVGISLTHGAEIAREAAHILLLENRIATLPDAVTLSRRAIARVRRNFTFSVGSNSVFLALGLLGLAPASLLALLHNASTVATCLSSLRPYLAATPTGGSGSGG